jgi:tetratricopeptide (TPR) repeat protein
MPRRIHISKEPFMTFVPDRKGLSAILLFFSFLFPGWVAGQDRQHLSNSDRSPSIAAFIEEHYQRANELRKAGKNEEALAVINEAIRFDSDCGKCFGMRAGIEGNLRKYQEGVSDGHMGVQRSKTPRNKAMSAYNKGFNLGGLNRNSEALEAYNDSIRFDPTYWMAYFGKGKVHYFLSEWAQSKAALEEALKQNPVFGPAWAYLAEDQINLRDVNAGMASANRAVQNSPSDPRSFRARTIANYWEKDYEAMLSDATRTLELDSTRPHAHFFRGHALRLVGREGEAATEFALEPDKEALAAGLSPAPRMDTRIYNCGDFSTEIQTATTFNTDSFTDCVKRINDQLDEAIGQGKARTKPKRPVPGLLPKKATKK